MPLLTEVHPDENHGGRDLRPLRPPALVPVRHGHVIHHVLGRELVVTLDVRADERVELASALVL